MHKICIILDISIGKQFLYIILLKCGAISLDNYIWSSPEPIFMIFFSNPSTQCADEPSDEKSLKMYQLNSFQKYLVVRVIAYSYTRCLPWTHTHIFTNPHYSYVYWNILRPCPTRVISYYSLLPGVIYDNIILL